MQTAIDRLHLGKEQEINIFDFDGYKQENRFVCPECGEFVFPAVGKRNGFRHYKKKDIECNRRVDGQALYTYSERVGLPLYLQRHNNTFELKIVFTPLKGNMLDLATAKKAQVIVSSDTYYPEKLIFNIDNFGFISNGNTYKKIDFVPPNEQNYKISISDSTLEKQIFEQWSDYADGFTLYGALFTYSENGGKKVHRNDTIEANTTYYWIVPKGYFKPKCGLTHNFEATLTFKKRAFDIYSISVKHQDVREFRDLANFFWECLKVRLLFIKPEIIPIWPPVIQTKQYGLVLSLNPKNSAVFCGVKSDNDEPAVYRYCGKEYSSVYVHKDMNQIKWVNLVLDHIPQPFTIDRKYLANSIILCQKLFSFSSDINDILSISSNNDIIPLESEIVINENCKELGIKSTKTITVICWNKNIPYKVFEISNEQNSTTLLSEKFSNIWIVEKSNSNLICTITRKQEGKKDFAPNLDGAMLLKAINKYIGEPVLPIPRKYKQIIHIIKKYPKCYSILATNILKGEIQPSIIKTMITGGLFNE